MAKRYFSDDYLDELTPKRARFEVGDSGCRGLIVRVQPSGCKSLYTLFKIHGGHPDPTKVGKNGQRLAGPQQRILLGRWRVDDITLEKARSRTNEIVQESRAGKDPREPGNVARANTLRRVATRYVDTNCKPNFKIGAEIESLFDTHIYPVLGDLPIAAITSTQIGELLDRHIDAGRVGLARKIRVRLTALYNWAKERDIVAHNPATMLRRDKLKAVKSAGYELRDAELRAVWAAALEMGYPYGDLYRLLMLTGQRWGDWSRASWHEVHDGMLDIPADRYKTGNKTGHGHTVPIVRTVQEILDGLPYKDRAEWLFWNVTMTGPATTKNTKQRTLDPLALRLLREHTGNDKAALHPFRVHDFRHTFETRLSRIGIREEVRRATQGHVPQGMTGQYNQHDFWAERVDALERYAVHLMEVVS